MKAAIYARVSSDSQDVDLSISAQLRALRDYAAKHDYEIAREFVDEAESGRTASRPAFKELIALARIHEPPFEAVLVWKLNRFSRSRVDSVTYKTLLKSKGIKVISINEPLDDSPSGKLLEGVIESIDEFYSANLGQDIKRGMRENAQRGFFNGSMPPYGLHKVGIRDGAKTRYKLQPDSENSVSVHVVRGIFDMALRDIGCKEIAKALNKEGIRTSTGQLWGKTTVHKVLTNEAYCGTLVWGGRPGHPAIRSGEPPMKVENAWPAIIDKENFNQVQAKMGSKKPSVTHPRTLPSPYLLSGLLYCSCGHAMIGRSAKSCHYHYYTCNGGYKQGKDCCEARALPKDWLEHVVINQVQDNVLNQECLEELVKLVNEELDSTHGILRDRLDTIDAELNEVKIKLSKLYGALETGKLSLDDLAPRIKELRTRQDELSKARIQTEADIVAQGAIHVDAEVVKSYAEDLKNLLQEANITESKAFLRSFIKRVEINNRQAVIHYNLPVPLYRSEKQSTEVLPIDTPGGAGGARTPYLLNAIQALSQMSYSPTRNILL
jgi:site-specific DNA recombinase